MKKPVRLTQVNLVLADYPTELRRVATRLRGKRTAAQLRQDSKVLDDLANGLDMNVAAILARFAAGG